MVAIYVFYRTNRKLVKITVSSHSVAPAPPPAPPAILLVNKGNTAEDILNLSESDDYDDDVIDDLHSSECLSEAEIDYEVVSECSRPVSA